MSDLVKHTSSWEQQSNQLWESYLETQQEYNELETPNQGFWASYHTLIGQVKASLKSINLIYHQETQGTPSIFSKHWPSSNYEIKGLKIINHKRRFLNVILIIALIAIGITLYKGQLQVALTIICLMMVISLVVFYFMDEVNGNSQPYKVKLVFEQDHLMYYFKERLYEPYIPIKVPYKSITALWNEQGSIKVIKDNLSPWWRSVDTGITYEVIIPDAIEEFQQIKLFFNDIIFLNQKQKHS